ncbi:hypothetical protein PBY51_001298 [Eleginops maclovinus]|uniref:Uncharacterized protein n=1 Tax=Eleginops maclovinus TaxID=56733 RepID=A0AAN7WVS9_ELEMC|nr:hypothetical protein PBY51_001298 [Eleginops maclovinus]
MESVDQDPPGPLEVGVGWVLARLQDEPWALGGAVVIGVFVLGFLGLTVFALLFGCCCSQQKQNQRRKRDGVI